MAEEEIEESGGGGGKGKLVLIIIVILLLIAGGVVGYMFFWPKEEPKEILQEAEETASLEMEKSKTDQTAVEHIEEPLFLPAQTYTVNLKDGRHYLQIEVSAMMKDQKAFDYLIARKLIIDDRIISILQNMSTEDLRSESGTYILKEQLFKMANLLFTPEFIASMDEPDRAPVKEILITKFVLN